MVRLREFFSGEETAMARTLRGQSMKASDEQRKKETERHTDDERAQRMACLPLNMFCGARHGWCPPSLAKEEGTTRAHP